MCFGKSSFVDFGSSRCRSGNRSRSSGRRGSRSRCSCRCGGLSRSGSGGRTSGFHFNNGSTFRYFVADFQEYGFNDTSSRTRYVHGRFVGFQSNQRVVFGNSVAHFDFNGDYIYISMTANIRNGYLNGCAARRSGSGCCGRRRLCFSNRSRSGFSSGSTGFNGQNYAAFGDFVTDFDFHFFDHACCIGRYVHSGFVGFQSNQGVVNGDGVARFDFYCDDIDVFMTADIRYFDFYDTHLSSFDDFGLRSSEKQFQTTSLMFSGTDNHFQCSFSSLRIFCTTCARCLVTQGLSVMQTVNVFLIQTTPQANLL